MKKSLFVDFKKLKQAVSIRRVLEHYGILESLKEEDDRLSGSCPICDTESKTAFRVSKEKNCFKCFSCNAGGNILDLVVELEDCSIREAALSIADWSGVDTGRGKRSTKKSRPSNPKSARKAPKQKAGDEKNPATVEENSEKPEVLASKENEVKGSDNPPLSFELKLVYEHPWFEKSGLTATTVEEFGIGYCEKGLMAGRIVFPIKNAEAQLIGYAGLWADEKLPEGKAHWKYPDKLNLDLVVYPAERVPMNEIPEALIATDPLQVVIAWQLQIKRVVCFPGKYPVPAGMRSLSISFG